MRRMLIAGFILSAGCVANVSTYSSTSSETEQQSPEGAAAQTSLPGGIRRLTAIQYQNTIRDLFGPDIEVTSSLDADVPLESLESLGAGSLTTTPQGASLYLQAAQEVATKRFSDPNSILNLLGCVPSTSMADACIENFINDFAARAFRRPLSSDELLEYKKLYSNLVATGESALQGLVVLTSAILSSPFFIYRVEIGELASNGKRLLNNYELASRLSYFLINSTPDNILMAAAQSGALATSDGLATQAKRLLQSSKSTDALVSFFEQWLGFSALASLDKDPNTFSTFTPTMGQSLRQEFYSLIRSYIQNPNMDFRTIFVTRNTFINKELAALYQVSLPTTVGEDGFAAATFPADGPRAGLLTLAGFLAQQAKPNATAPITRGHYIRTRLLCQSIQPPPANVDQLPPAVRDGKPVTMRQRLAAHQSNASCVGCHSQMDPLGLPFEHFDGIGAYRATDNGLDIDASGQLDEEPFDGAVQLGQLLMASKQVQNCFVRQMYRQAIGVKETSSTIARLNQQASDAATSGFSVHQIVLNLIMSDLFREAGVI